MSACYCTGSCRDSLGRYIGCPVSTGHWPPKSEAPQVIYVFGDQHATTIREIVREELKSILEDLLK